jgi:hypothetical protein
MEELPTNYPDDPRDAVREIPPTPASRDSAPTELTATMPSKPPIPTTGLARALLRIIRRSAAATTDTSDEGHTTALAS